MDQTLPDLAPGAAAPAPAPAPSRRQVLALVAVTGAGGVLITACGGGDDTSTTEPGGSSSSSDAGGSSPSASEGGGGGAGGALVASSEVPVGGGVILEKQNVVVCQPAKGTFTAFSATCTHRACTVSSVKNDRISCACHGSAYSAKDGSVVNGPATRALAEVPVAVEGGQVVKS